MNFSKSELFLISCFVFIFGAGIASFLPVDFIKNDLLCLALIIIALSFLFLYKRGFIFIFFFLVIFLSFFRYSLSIPLVNETDIQFYNEQKVDFIATIINDPEIKIKNQKFIISSHAMNSESVNTFNNVARLNVRGKILVTTNKFPKYNYGDNLRLECKLKTPEEFDGFAYDRFLAKSEIYSLCYNPKIEKIGEDNGSIFFAFIFKIKNKMREIIARGLPSEEASLARAIILGDKYVISDEQREIFSRAGVSHMMAISGMHIGIIYLILVMILFEFGLWRSQVFYIGFTVLFFYILLIGFPASAIRAWFMLFLILLAQISGRLNQIDRSVYIAATILLLINPRLLRDDVGFQLSFLAILAIVYLYPVFDNFLDGFKFYKYHDWIKKGVNIFFLTIAIQFFTLPILVYNFGQISLVAPITNILILWCLPFLLTLLILAVILSLVFPLFSYIFFFPAKALLIYMSKISELVSNLPLAYLQVNNILYLAIIYIFLIIIFFWIYWSRKRIY